jgi:hypothetical protein
MLDSKNKLVLLVEKLISQENSTKYLQYQIFIILFETIKSIISMPTPKLQINQYKFNK